MMGIFGDFKKSLSESPGRILLSQLKDTEEKLFKLSDPIAKTVLIGFAKKRQLLLVSLNNWTSDGCIQMGKTLQTQARQTLDMNVSEGYALWLAGAWLESMNRPGPEAAQVHKELNMLATIVNEREE